MVAVNGTNHNGYVNGNGSNGHARVLECASDHPIIDVTPRAPRNKWRDELAPVTWSLAYTDSSGISHSVTLRGDSEQEVLDMVKPLVAGVRKAQAIAKEKHTGRPETQPEHVVCKIHNVEMQRRVSKRTGGHYHCHRLAGNNLCFGRVQKA